MKHEIKCWPQYYQRVVDGVKTFEVRINDRGYQYGDFVLMREWDPVAGAHTGRESSFNIGFIYPISRDEVVLSIVDLKVIK